MQYAAIVEMLKRFLMSDNVIVLPFGEKVPLNVSTYWRKHRLLLRTSRIIYFY